LRIDSQWSQKMTMQQAGPETTLFIVDDDAWIRQALSVVFTQEGYQVSDFADGNAFLAAARTHTPSCILLDVHMPGRSGINVLKDLDAQHYGAPIFIISAQGEIPLAVDAIKAGAFDFIEKPFDPDSVVARVRRAIAEWKRPSANGHDGQHSLTFSGEGRLTPREREVLSQIASGASNREAGDHLAISPRTVEVHRARIMGKLGARNAADLVRIVLTTGRREQVQGP
jgi:FixJ family two-component response regulator